MDSLVHGDIPMALAFLHYLLLEHSLDLAKEVLAKSRTSLRSLNDARFVTEAFRILMDSFRLVMR